MAEVNDAFIAGAPYQPQNPLTQVGQIASTIGQLQQNRLFPLQQQMMGAQVQGQQIQNVTNQRAQNEAATNRIYTIAAQFPPGTNPTAVISALNAGAATGLYTPDQLATMLGSGDLTGFINRSVEAAGTPQEQSQTIGAAAQTNVGNAIKTNVTKIGPQGASVSPAEGPAATLATTLTPEQKASRVAGINPQTLAPESAPLASLATDTGQPKTLAGFAGPGGVVQTGAAPGQAEGRTALGQASGAQYAGDLADAGDSGRRVAILKEVEGLLQTPEGKTGPSTQVVNGWRNFLLANIPALSGTPDAPTEMQVKAATQDLLKKYMTQIAGNAAAQYGPGTNEKLAVAASGNANPDLSNLANQDVTRMNIALERAKQARLAAFQASGQPAESYSTYSSNWNRQVDPRGFMLDLLAPSERGKMLGTITTPAGKAAILRAKAAAEAAGLYQEGDIPR